MSNFAKVTGRDGTETNLNFLRGEVARLSGENAALNQELVMRAAPRMAEVMDAVTHFTNLSRAGNPEAKRILKSFFELLDMARAEAGSLSIVRANGS